MPTLTKHYNLTAFQFGDAYSASADKRRFTIIDNEMSFLAEQIGDGVIDGWGITTLNSTAIRIAPGMGIIDGFLTVTYGSFDLELPNNRRQYIFMRRKPEIIAEVGAFCNVVSTPYTDLTPPSQPATPTLVDKDYNFVEITWTASTAVDISHYRVFRNAVEIAQSDTNSYKDESVAQNTAYTYTIRATDFNSNSSILSAGLAVTTDADVRVPSDPTEVDVLTGNESLQVYWTASNFLANQYKITLQPITLEGVPDGAATIATVSNTTFYRIFTGLVNGQLYEITVQAVSSTNILSPGVVGRGTPMYSGGATELATVTVIDSSLNLSYRLALTLSWTLQAGSTPDYYLVTIYRDGEKGVPSIYTALSNVIVRYTVRIGDNEYTRDIEEETKYNIRIQTVADDVQSNGFVVRIRTKKFRPPQPVVNLAVAAEYSVNRRSVVATWENSASEFAYNAVTVRKVNLDTNVITVLATNANVGQSSRYALQLSDVQNMYQYEFDVIVHDTYANVSETTTAVGVLAKTFSTAAVNGVTVANSGVRPPVPSEQFTISGDDQVTIYWNKADSDFVNGYKIYRAVFADGYASTDFTAVATLPANVRKLNDYAVVNGTRYVYFVTTVDVFGNESANPADSYFYYTLLFAAPRSHSLLSKAPSITLQNSGHNVIVSWTAGDDAFDGYEIFRSKNNQYSFVAVGSAGPAATSFTDVNALTANGTYYYMVRKFRNEAEIFASRSRLAPAGTLSLGVATRVNSTITIDQSDLYDIKLLADPIKDEVAAQLSSPTHLYYGKGDDRRVRLQNDLVVTEWTTTDYQIYTTEFSLASTADYIAYVDGIQSAYGTVVDTANQTITFEQPIFDPSVNDGKAEADQIDPPVVTVIFTSVGETTGELPMVNVEDLSATKITKGKLTEESMPQLDHFGRYREPCLPKRTVMTQINPQEYSGGTPDGITFYDVVKTPTGRIVAATSAGVIVSSANGGSSVTYAATSDFPVTRIIYCPYLEMYFAACGRTVKISSDLVLWQTPSGMDGATFVRDLATDANGTVYATCDAGVYKIQPLDFTKLFWEQLPVFDADDTNAYAAYYDLNADGLIVGGSSGIYGTFDEGENWARLDTGEIQVPVHSIWMDGGTVFLVSNNKVWRNGTAESVYVPIGDFTVPCRKGIYFAGDFYVTTDHGLFKSSSENNVLTDANVKWEVAFKNTHRNGIIPATHALRLLDGRLWMGQDERVYSATVKRKVYTHMDIAGTCPTVYVDDAERSVGVYYSQANKVMFDTRISKDGEVSIVQDYTFFTAINGGWADRKYDAEVIITVDGNDIIGPVETRLIDGRWWRFPPKPWTPDTTPKNVSAAVQQIQTPFFNGRNSNFDKANESLKKIVRYADDIETINFLAEQDTIPHGLVAQLFQELDRFKTLIHSELRPLIVYPPITGVVNYNGFTAIYDVVNGTLDITNGVNKYSRVSLSVKGVFVENFGVLSHDEIEDAIEKVNSGLTSAMALVQQSNMVKAGIYHQHIDPNALKNGKFTYQAVHHAACDSWYNKLMSTLDYSQKLSQLPPQQGSGEFKSSGFSIDYPADVLYVQSKGEVWVCGAGGIIAVNTTTYDTRMVYGSPFYFYNMSLSEGIVYALAEDGIYKIVASSGFVSKDVNTTPPAGSSSVLVSGNTTYIATTDGVYSKRAFEIGWSKVFSLTNATIRSTSRLSFAKGKSIDDATDSLVYYSYAGVIWNRSNVFDGIEVNDVTQRYDSVYYATNSGLVHEDLSRLFSNSNFGGPTLSAVELEEDEDNAAIRVNAVDADDDRVIVATDTGKWYSMTGVEVDGSGLSRLGTIHKVKVVAGDYWLFSGNLIEIENVNKLVPLSIGKALL